MKPTCQNRMGLIYALQRSFPTQRIEFKLIWARLKGYLKKMSVKREIEEKLRNVFDIRKIVVVDDSASHAGHSGAPEAGESHFNVMLRCPEFAGKTRIFRHRAVHDALGSDLLARMHALALDLDQ